MKCNAVTSILGYISIDDVYMLHGYDVIYIKLSIDTHPFRLILR